MITRRKIVFALGAGALAPLASFAQQPAKVYRIGFIGVGLPSNMVSRVEGLRAGLRDLGYVEGKNLVIEYRWAEGKAERLPELAAELVRLNVDLIVTHGIGATAAKQATSTIPIVVAATSDFIAQGLAASLARPGGNVTGGSVFGAEVSAKGLELLKDAIPGLNRVALLLPPVITQITLDAITATAKHLKVTAPQFIVQGGTDFEGTYAAMVKQRVGAVLVPDNAFMNVHGKTIADLALKHRLALCGVPDIAEAGGLLGYGVNYPEMFRRAAVFVDKIFKGIKPGDIPIERATRFDVVLNMKTAKALGLEIPNSILVQATKVIQ